MDKTQLAYVSVGSQYSVYHLKEDCTAGGYGGRPRIVTTSESAIRAGLIICSHCAYHQKYN